VQLTQQAAECRGTVQAPGTGLGELAINERQHLAAPGVKAGADQARCGGEAGVLKVAQQRMHRCRPRPCITDHHVAPAVNY